MKNKVAVLYLFPEQTVASQRFRLENVIEFFGEENFELIHLKKGFLNFFLNEFKILLCFKFDKIIFNRWPTHFGFSLSLIVISFFKKIIFDFDDAIWTSEKKSILNFYKKVLFRINCNISHKIICGNNYLKNKVNLKKAIVIPTCLNKSFFGSIEFKKNTIVNFGWTGSNSTLKYLEQIIGEFDKLEQSGLNFRLSYMSNSKSSVLESRKYTFFQKWDILSEIQFIDDIDFGIMPLDQTDWEKGKCGFKLLQYLSRGKYSIADMTNVNKKILEDGRGLIIKNNWFESLMFASKNIKSNKKSSVNFIKNNFSIKSNSKIYSKILFS